MDEYELYEKEITEALAKYRAKRDKQLYKKINHKLDLYHLYLDENFAAQAKYEWYSEQKRHLNQLKRQKDDIANQNIPSSSVVRKLNYEQDGKLVQNQGLEFTKNLQNQINNELTRVIVGTQKAVEISAYIKVQLNRQIQLLDQVYEENRDMESRLNRVKKGLIVILRRAMLNKLTRFLVVLLVLAVIALIVLYILKGKSII